MTGIWLHSENNINFPLTRVERSRYRARSPRQRGIPSATSARQPLPAVAVAKRYDTNLKTLCLGGSAVNAFSCLVPALPG